MTLWTNIYTCMQYVTLPPWFWAPIYPSTKCNNITKDSVILYNTIYAMQVTLPADLGPDSDMHLSSHTMCETVQYFASTVYCSNTKVCCMLPLRSALQQYTHWYWTLVIAHQHIALTSNCNISYLIQDIIRTACVCICSTVSVLAVQARDCTLIIKQFCFAVYCSNTKVCCMLPLRSATHTLTLNPGNSTAQ